MTRFTFFTLPLALLTLPATSLAQSSDGPALLADAQSEYGQGHLPEARALFLRSFDASHDPSVLVLLGQTEFEMREYVDCVRHLRAALAATTNPVRPRARAAAEGVLGRAAAFVGEYTLDVEPADAHLTVDDEVVANNADPLIVTIGMHTLVARAAGHDELRRTFRTVGGEHQPLEIAMAPTATATAPTTTTTTDTHVDIATPQVDIHTTEVAASPPADHPPEHSTDAGMLAGGIAGFVVAVAGVGMLIGGGVQYSLDDAFLNSPPTHAGETSCSGTMPNSMCATDRSDRDTMTGLMIGGGIAVLVGVAVGIPLVLLAGGGGSSQHSATVGCTPTVTGAVCAGRF
jgi:hypothetical protein